MFHSNRTFMVAVAVAVGGWVSQASAALVAHYKFDNSGSLTTNSVLGGVALTQVGTVTSTTGVAASNGINLAGGGKFNANFAGALSTTELTISLWADIPDTQTNFDDFWAFSLTPSTTRSVFLEVNGSGQTPVLFSPSPPIAPAAPDLGTGGFHHLVATFSAAENVARLYVDGALAGSTTWNVAGLMNQFTIGGEFDTGVRNITGLLDDVQIYNQALTASQVSFLFNNPGIAVIIPEPATAGLALFALGALALRRRRLA